MEIMIRKDSESTGKVRLNVVTSEKAYCFLEVETTKQVSTDGGPINEWRPAILGDIESFTNE